MRGGSLLEDADKLVAAILAAAKVSSMGGQRPAADYIAEYESFLGALRKPSADLPAPETGQWEEVDAELKKHRDA